MSNYSFRYLTENDLEFFLEIRNECSDMLHDDSKFTLEQAKEWFNTKKPEFLMIIYKDVDIGYFRFSNKTEKSMYIGCDIHKNWRGKKLTPMAYILIMFDLFFNSNIEEIYLEVLSINTIAYNLYNKLCFNVQNSKYHQIDRNGQLIDSILMSINKHDFLENIKNGKYNEYITRNE